MTTNRTAEIEKLDRQLSETDDPIEKARIYLRAGQVFFESSDMDEACFFMTQAFVFAAHNGEKLIENTARQFLAEHNRI